MNKIDTSIECKYEKIVKIIDVKTFDICQIKETEYGRLLKRRLFVHFNGSSFTLLIEADKGQFKLVSVERGSSPPYII